MRKDQTKVSTKLFNITMCFLRMHKIFRKNETTKQYDEINTLLDSLPSNVWNNKSLKWLDLSVGYAHFILPVYLRLFEGLRTVIKDRKERKRHILDKMLYFCSSDKYHLLITLKMLGYHENFRFNFFYYKDKESLSKDKLVKIFKIKKFDIVLVHPPFNIRPIKEWVDWPFTRFLEIGLNILEVKGFLVCAIIPSWLKLTQQPFHSLILDKHVIFLTLWDDIKMKETFNVRKTYSFFILHNLMNREKKETRIITEFFTKRWISCEYLNTLNYIPLGYHSIFVKLAAFIKKYDLSLKTNQYTGLFISENTPIPSEYQSIDKLTITNCTAETLLVKKSTCVLNFPWIYKKKLILVSNPKFFFSVFIDSGRLMAGEGHFCILGNDLAILEKMFSFRLIDMISVFTKYSERDMAFGLATLTYLPDLRRHPLKKTMEDENAFYNAVGFSAEEKYVIYQFPPILKKINSPKSKV